MTPKNKKIAVIGAGFSGLSTAAFLAKKGFDVTVFDQHEQAGGRARAMQQDQFLFDLGPSWYWMPDSFERFFAAFGKKPSDYYQLKRLDPSYRVFWEQNEQWDIPANYQEFLQLMESAEKGAAQKTEDFLAQAKIKYEVGMNDFVHRPSLSIMEFMDWQIAQAAVKLDLLKNMSDHIRQFYKDSKIIRLMEFPVLFLGAMPDQIPALYSMMNYADIQLGTWYPIGGMSEVVRGMVSVAKEQGVKFELGKSVEKISVHNGKAESLLVDGNIVPFDSIVSSGDYHHTETQLLPKEARSYSDSYWESRTMAPSCLLYYLGVNKKVEGLLHHNLFFDTDFKKHAQEIYSSPQWPSDPLFYACVPSKTDTLVAPEGHENIFLLIPVAPGMPDTPEIREKYLHLLIDRLEARTGESIREHIVTQKSFAYQDFVSQYHSFKGNAYGLANTLRQTAFLKPKMKSKKVKNLFYAGQLTVPGPGVPPALISGEVAANQVEKYFSK